MKASSFVGGADMEEGATTTMTSSVSFFPPCEQQNAEPHSVVDMAIELLLPTKEVLIDLLATQLKSMIKIPPPSANPPTDSNYRFPSAITYALYRSVLICHHCISQLSPYTYPACLQTSQNHRTDFHAHHIAFSSPHRS
jgi:hypothetical protein